MRIAPHIQITLDDIMIVETTTPHKILIENTIQKHVVDDSTPNPCVYDIQEIREDSYVLGEKLQVEAKAAGYFILHIDRTSERHRMITVLCPHKHRTVMSCMTDWNNPICIGCNTYKEANKCVYSESQEGEYIMDLNEPITEHNMDLDSSTIEEDSPLQDPEIMLPEDPRQLSSFDMFCKQHKLRVVDDYIGHCAKHTWICEHKHKFVASFVSLKSYQQKIHFSLCKYCDIKGYENRNKITCTSNISKSFNRITKLEWKCNVCDKEFSTCIRSKPRCPTC